jgi:hypothetical protein
MSDAMSDQNSVYTDKPIYGRRMAARADRKSKRAGMRKSVSKLDTPRKLSTLILAYAAIALVGYHAYSIRTSCESGWVSSVLKAIGIQVLASFMILAVTMPLFAFNSDREIVHSDGTERDIAAITYLQNMMWHTEFGPIVHLVLSFLLARWWLICRDD